MSSFDGTRYHFFFITLFFARSHSFHSVILLFHTTNIVNTLYFHFSFTHAFTLPIYLFFSLFCEAVACSRTSKRDKERERASEPFCLHQISIDVVFQFVAGIFPLCIVNQLSLRFTEIAFHQSVVI